jgi:hypothetical protein
MKYTCKIKKPNISNIKQAKLDKTLEIAGSFVFIIVLFALGFILICQ